MKKLLLIAITTLFLLPAIAQKSNLSVLYVGINPAIYKGEIKGYGTKETKDEKKLRWADFEQFLNKHFNTVKMVHNADYKQSMSDHYDVTIFDAPPKPIKKGIRERKADGSYLYEAPVYLTNDYSAATLTISTNSKNIGESLHTKLDWC